MQKKTETGVLAKESFIKANIAPFVLGFSRIPEIMGGKERRSDWHRGNFSSGKKAVYI